MQRLSSLIPNFTCFEDLRFRINYKSQISNFYFSSEFTSRFVSSSSHSFLGISYQYLCESNLSKDYFDFTHEQKNSFVSTEISRLFDFSIFSINDLLMTKSIISYHLRLIKGCFNINDRIKSFIKNTSKSFLWAQKLLKSRKFKKFQKAFNSSQPGKIVMK